MPRYERDFSAPLSYHPLVPRDARDDAKHDADRGVWFFDRCLARGLSRAEAVELTVAYLLGLKAGPQPEPKREPWEE